MQLNSREEIESLKKFRLERDGMCLLCGQGYDLAAILILAELSKSSQIPPLILTCREYFRFYIRFRRGPVGGFITQPTPPELSKRWLSGTPPCQGCIFKRLLCIFHDSFQPLSYGI